MNEKRRLLIFPVGRKLMGVTIAYLLGIWSGAVFAPGLWSVGLLGLMILCAVVLRARRHRSVYWLFLLFALAAGSFACNVQLSVNDLPTQPNTLISGTIVRIESDYRVMLDDVELPDGQRTHRPVVVTLMTQENEPVPPTPKVGQYVSGTGRLFAPDEIRNPGGTDGRIRALCSRYELSGYILPGWMAEGAEAFSAAECFRRLRLRLMERVERLFGDEAALFMAVMLGERSEIDAEVTAAMRLTGTAHILSVSGMHLNLISATVGMLLGFLPIGKRAKRLIHVSALVMFTGLTGFAVGTVRALIMTLMRLYAKVKGLRYDRLTALSFAALAITVCSPVKAFDGGFQFSFFVVLGITLLEKPLSALPPLRFLLRHARSFGELLIVALSAQIAAIPMQLSLYGYIPLLSLPMNLLSSLLMPLIMTGGWCVLLIGLAAEEMAMVCAQALSYAGSLFETLSVGATQLSVSILRLPAPRRGILLLVCCAMMLVSGIIRFGRLRKAAFLASVIALIVLYLPQFDPAARYVQLDVGQGDASLIRSGRHVVVVDVGPESSYDLIRYLRHEGLFVDAVVLSHLDKDHAGALKSLLSSEIDVNRVIMAEGAQDSLSSVAVMEGLRLLDEMDIEPEQVKAGDVVSAADVQMIVLSPNDTLSGSNERSLLLYVSAAGKTLLLTGDLPEDCEPEIVPPCDVLKVAHHGSRYASTPEFLSMVQPEMAIISVGASNWYGHPHERVLSDLDAVGAKVLRTDHMGCITVYLEEELRAKTMLDPSGRNLQRVQRIFRQATEKEWSNEA